MQKKRLVVVLGMHRSGTSAITRGLRALGVALGERTAPGVVGENDKGFWEDVDLQELNNQMLSFLDSSWDDVRPVSSADVTRLERAGFPARCQALLAAKLDAESVFGLKDPRLARLIPFWGRVFRDCSFDVVYVIALRNPLSVVRSLAKRNGMDPVQGYLLWADHVLASLLATEGEGRVLVDYDLLMAEPTAQLQRMAAALSLSVIDEELAIYRDSFIDEGLRHAAFGLADLEADPACLDVVRHIYAGLLSAAGSDSGLPPATLAEWCGELDRMAPLVSLAGRLGAQIRQHARREQEWSVKEGVQQAQLDAVCVELSVTQEKLSVTKAQLQAIACDADRLGALVELMQRSLSWRITRPLRFLARLVRHGLVGEDRQRLGAIARRWYHRLPISWALRQRVSGLYRRLRRNGARLMTSRHDPWSLPGPEVFLAPPQRDSPDYVVWGVIDWHFRHQRPQHLAQSVADSGRRVFYISSSLIDSDVPGFTVEPIGSAGRLFSVRLHVNGVAAIYSAAPSHEQESQLRASAGRLALWFGAADTVSLVQHPFWLAAASVLPGARLVYDCMDHHEGFGNVPPEMIALERSLLAMADLTVTTSAWLNDVVSDKTSRRTIIRNAGEFAHFSERPADVHADRKGRRIIGYYGAIAEWFDVELVAKIAQHFPDCAVVLVGADTVNARGALGRYPNVVFTGEIPYTELPRYLHAFDVCLLPFRVVPLTLATNPVKVYEYLSAGKPAVVVDLPEMAQFNGLVDVALDHDEFLPAIARHLSAGKNDTAAAARRAFAREQTWAHRAQDLIAQVESSGCDPLVSVVVLTYNNIELTKACLSSLEAHSHYDNIEVIVVDNASGDGTQEFLIEWAGRATNRRLVLNEQNKGFSAGNNDGLAIASGEYLVLLNNDTYVTPGWVRTMVNHCRRDKSIGLLGPVTNNIGNEARIDIAYDSMDEMLVRSAEHTRLRLGQTFPLRTAAFFCVMIPRRTYEQAGPLDEAFGRGFFEDDDYCRRVEQLGLRVVCADDVFIHHHLSASFNKLKQQDRQRLFEENRKIYEAKWGSWVPHSYRPPGELK